MNWKEFGTTVQVLSTTNFLNSPELYNFLQGKTVKFLSEAKDICSLTDFFGIVKHFNKHLIIPAFYPKKKKWRNREILTYGFTSIDILFKIFNAHNSFKAYGSATYKTNLAIKERLSHHKGL